MSNRTPCFTIHQSFVDRLSRVFSRSALDPRHQGLPMKVERTPGVAATGVNSTHLPTTDTYGSLVERLSSKSLSREHRSPVMVGEGLPSSILLARRLVRNPRQDQKVTHTKMRRIRSRIGPETEGDRHLCLERVVRA